MYPALKDGVSLGTFQYKGSETTCYYIENADGEVYEISHELWDVLLQADGTKPLELPDGGREILPTLEEYGFVRTSRFVREDSIFNYFVLFPIGSKTKSWGPVCRAMNAVLPAASVLIFILGVCLMASRGVDTGDRFSWLWFYGLFFASLTLHEVGHLVAGLAAGYRIRDTGILLLGILPIGAYVSHEVKEEVGSAEEIQFALAGVEVNLLLAGMLLLVAALYFPLSLTLVAAANTNVILAAINLLPAPGLDGESALSAVYEVDSISDVAKKWLRDRRHRRTLLRLGLPGGLSFCIFAFILLSGVLFWLLIGLDLLSLLFCLI